MLLSLTLVCCALAMYAAWRGHRLALELNDQACELARQAVLRAEAQRYLDSRRQLSDTQQLSEAAIQLGASTVRTVHEGIASIPFAILESIPGVRAPVRAVRMVHDSIAGSVYDSIGAVNKMVGKTLRGELGKSAAKDDKSEKP